MGQFMLYMGKLKCFKQGVLDEEATMQNYYSSGYGKNVDGYYFNPNIDEYDPNYDSKYLIQSSSLEMGTSYNWFLHFSYLYR